MCTSKLKHTTRVTVVRPTYSYHNTINALVAYTKNIITGNDVYA